MGVGKNKASVSINDHTGTQAASFCPVFVSMVEKILEKGMKPGVHSICGKRAHIFHHLIFRAYIYHCRTNLADSLDNGILTGVFGKCMGRRSKREKKKRCREEDKNNRKIFIVKWV
jgi:hypothetical protein